MQDSGSRSTLFALTLPAVRESLAFAAAAVEPLIAQLHLGDREAVRVRLAVEEACLNAIDHAYAPGQQGDFVLRAGLERSSLVLSVEDHGMPRDPFARPAFSAENPEASGLGTRLLEGMLDEVRYLALGRGGKAVEMLVRLPAVTEEASHEDRVDAAIARILPETLEIRAFRPEDAGQIAQCAYRCYDYSYIGEHLYVPDSIISMNRSGEMVSIVAAGPEGKIYGHAALLFSPGAPAPESGQAFVVPEARGGGTFRKIKLRLLEAARERGAPGVWSEAVTNHPASQRANVELGAQETGIIFGILPTDMRMRNMPGLSGHRGSLLLFYLSLEEHPRSHVCFPLQHRGMISDIYLRLGFAIHEITPQMPPARRASEVTVGLRSDIGVASLRVQVIGADLATVVLHEIARVCDSGARIVTLDLPMADPALPSAVTELEFHGCHFAGLIPRRYEGGDSLRLTYLDHARIDLLTLQFASDVGRAIRDYCARGLSPDLLVSGTD